MTVLRLSGAVARPRAVDAEGSISHRSGRRFVVLDSITESRGQPWRPAMFSCSLKHR
jgi:hypothetical protein